MLGLKTNNTPVLNRIRSMILGITVLTFVLSCNETTEKHEGKTIAVNNTRLYYEESGKGAPLLLLHGGFGSANDFEKITGELATRFRVIAPDSPGHGRSEQADSLSYSLLADYFSHLIDKLELDSVYVLGWSDGGNTALLLAANRPDKVKKVMVCGANAAFNGYTAEALDFFEHLSPGYIETEMTAWLDTYQQQSPHGERWEKYINDVKKMWSQTVIIDEDQLKKIRARTIVVLGDRDLVRLEHGIYIYRTVVNSEFCVLPNTSHFMFAEKPQLLLPIIFSFFGLAK
jgi:pimeloyl-ACP methyl ester carboxylesterase